jgi:hypothetical protein
MTVPPLLALAAGKKVRPRRAPIIRRLELSLHYEVAKILQDFALPTWRWSHFPAGEHRNIQTAQRLKRMGLQRGWPDMILVGPDGRFYALELKRRGETLNPDQEVFQTWCVARGVPYSVADTLDQAIVALGVWGVLRFKIGGAP